MKKATKSFLATGLMFVMAFSMITIAIATGEADIEEPSTQALITINLEIIIDQARSDGALDSFVERLDDRLSKLTDSEQELLGTMFAIKYEKEIKQALDGSTNLGEAVRQVIALGIRFYAYELTMFVPFTVCNHLGLSPFVQSFEYLQSLLLRLITFKLNGRPLSL